MNHKNWKNTHPPRKAKVTCLHPQGSQRELSSRDYVLGGYCHSCFFKAGSWLNPQCSCPVRMELGQTIRYQRFEQVQFLKKVAKIL